MKQTDPIVYTRHDDWVEIVLNRADKGNALTMPMLEDLWQIAGTLEYDRDIRVIVIRGSGERFFCTGGDIAAWGRLTPHDMARDWILRGSDVFARLSRLPQAVIAALNGHTLGGGLELAMAADLRVCVASAKFGNPEVTLGMIPGWMGVSRLSEMVGVARARHLSLLGTPISASQALDWGLVSAVVDSQEDLAEQVRQWRERLCANAPSAIALIKGLLETAHTDMRHHHASAVAQAAATEDCKEGVRAFIEKRKPVYHNR